MDFNYSLHNFRSFNEDGISIKFKPITILTGCNSSGKSSIVKSLQLLERFLRNIIEDIRNSGWIKEEHLIIDITAADLNLGTFDNVVNRNAEKKEFYITYTIAPDCAVSSYTVELYFKHKEDDFLQRGYLHKFIIKDAEKNIFVDFEVRNGGFQPISISLDAIVIQFLRFSLINHSLTLQKMIYKSESLEEYGMSYINDAKKAKLLGYIKDVQAIFEKTGVYSTELNYKKFNPDKYAKRYPALFNEELTPILLKLHAMKTCLFYFPLFEQLENKSKEEQINLMEQAMCDADLFSQNFDDLKKITIDSFRKSSYNSFIEYFANLQNDLLHEMVLDGANSFVVNKDPYISLQKNLEISFNNSGCLHDLWRETKNTEFESVYNFLSIWQWHISSKDDFIERDMTLPMEFYYSTHKVYKALSEYALLLFECLLDPDFIGNINYIGNFHSDVKRMYSFDDKSSSMVRILKAYISSKKILEELYGNSHFSNPFYKERFKKYKFKPGTFINKWIKKMKLGYGISIVPDRDMLGAKIFIRKDKHTIRGYSIVDEGAGVAQILTFLLYIENEILDNLILMCREELKKCKEEIPGQNMNIPTATTPSKTLMLEEPEIGLHPALQSNLAEIFNDAYMNYGINFIIETHSEYLVRKTQVLVAQMHLTEEEIEDKNPYRVYYIEKNQIPVDLIYQPSGRFVNEFGPGFFDESTNLVYKLY